MTMTSPSDDVLDEKILALSEKKALPSGEPIDVLAHPRAWQLADSSHTGLGKIYYRAALRGIFPERFLRNAKALTAQEQATLLGSRAAVVGLGGLGGTVVEILARIGVGALTLIDGDGFEESNLNRQLLSTVETLGAGKAEEAGRRVRAVNPAVDLTIHGDFFTPQDAGFFEGADLVVDCLDTITARFDLESAAKAASKPLVSAAVAGAAGHVTTVFPEDPGLAAIYGQPGDSARKGSEAELGCLPQAVVLLASMEASEAIKVLLGKGALLRNRLLLVDLFHNTFETIELS
jgi:molybdopterin/thiamine biosynthesis adenylyltransferase